MYANNSHKKKSDAIAIRDLLNYYETISVGVKTGIYDIEMIKQSQKTMITNIFYQSKPFIDKSREIENNKNLYVEFESFIEILQS